MNLTPAQQTAIAARGNVLVVAGAGTGKTRTLVERCLHCVLEETPPASLDELLVVTFTEAAAAEMRRRIREGLGARLQTDPRDTRCREQLALFDAAHIGTLHSFCLKLVRQHFYELELDPQLMVLAEDEARLLAEETLDSLLQEYYAGAGDLARAVQQLIQTQGRGRTRWLRPLVFKLHGYTQTLPDPANWFAAQLAMFDASKPDRWRTWLIEGFLAWRADWQETSQWLGADSPRLAECAAALNAVSATPCAADLAAALGKIREIAQDPPRLAQGDAAGLPKQFFEDASFFFSLVRTSDGGDPLAEDWDWVRSPMATLLRLTQEFNRAFLSSKRELGALDFHDLEQYALQLLWDSSAGQPTAIARQWRDKLRFILVDEYQDINAAQDRIIQALSREGVQANRFLVGDVKQSIYRFRLANPRIFQEYAVTWDGELGRTIPLTDNFRSRQVVLEFVNSLFALLMRREIGNIDYDERTKLRFGAPDDRRDLSRAADPEPRVELHLRLKGSGGNDEAGDGGDEALAAVAELQEADKEARLVALRLRELKDRRHPVRDETSGVCRAVEWSDMAVLLRSPANKVESYARQFSRLNVPLAAARGAFYQSLEVSDLLNLLRLFDNPLQDVPALAVLHSPFVGLNLEELATIRLAALKTHFWTALQRWHETQKAAGGTNEAFEKVDVFLRRFARWRRLARQVSLPRCLETVLAETHYADWLLTQPRGAQRHANVQRLLDLSQQFDEFQRQGLFRFLRLIEAEQAAETEREAAPVPEEDAVRLMSIHQSKGLQFPVVVIADLGKAFNFADFQEGVIVDEQFGVCAQVKAPHSGRRYPSLPYWLARRRQKRELLGEEMRLLYVAMTRACDTLILTASIPEKKFNTQWRRAGEINTSALLDARSHADWLGSWFSGNCETGRDVLRSGQSALLRWEVHHDPQLTSAGSEKSVEPPPVELTYAAEPGVWRKLHDRLSWRYPFTAATVQPAKMSVSGLRRQASGRDEESRELFLPDFPSRVDLGKAAPVAGHERSPRASASRQSGADIGTAHHKFLQFVSLDQVGSNEELRREVQRMERERILLPGEAALLNVESLGAFWRSDLGRRVCVYSHHVRRELAFAARFTPAELDDAIGRTVTPGLEDEFVVIQGVADLVVILPEAIWLVDFKTDDVKPEGLPEKVKAYEPQLKLYGRALSRIYRRRIGECWLQFLSAGIAVPVAAEGGSDRERGPD